jgi:HK97 gp10 family phage protein
MNTIRIRIDNSKIQLIERLCNERLQVLAETVTTYAKDESPVATGTNKRSITYDFDKDTKRFRIYTQSGYGAFLELGTFKMPAKPYMMPALLKGASVVKAIFEDTI